jgi:hypothetical protein
VVTALALHFPLPLPLILLLELASSFSFAVSANLTFVAMRMGVDVRVGVDIDVGIGVAALNSSASITMILARVSHSFISPRLFAERLRNLGSEARARTSIASSSCMAEISSVFDATVMAFETLSLPDLGPLTDLNEDEDEDEHEDDVDTRDVRNNPKTPGPELLCSRSLCKRLQVPTQSMQLTWLAFNDKQAKASSASLFCRDGGKKAE